jgi:hypothetical protein
VPPVAVLANVGLGAALPNAMPAVHLRFLPQKKASIYFALTQRNAQSMPETELKMMIIQIFEVFFSTVERWGWKKRVEL